MLKDETCHAALVRIAESYDHIAQTVEQALERAMIAADQPAKSRNAGT